MDPKIDFNSMHYFNSVINLRNMKGQFDLVMSNVRLREANCEAKPLKC